MSYTIPKYSDNADLDWAIKNYRHLLRTDASFERIKKAREIIQSWKDKIYEGTV